MLCCAIDTPQLFLPPREPAPEAQALDADLGEENFLRRADRPEEVLPRELQGQERVVVGAVLEARELVGGGEAYYYAKEASNPNSVVNEAIIFLDSLGIANRKVV